MSGFVLLLSAFAQESPSEKAVLRVGVSPVFPPMVFKQGKEPVAWGIRKGDDKLLAAANEFIQKASQDGTLNRIFRRWMAVPR